MNHLTWTESLNAFYQKILQFIYLNIFFLIIMSAFRLFSQLYYGDPRELNGASAELAKAYWIGFRFDLSALCYLAVLPFMFLLSLCLLRNKKLFKKTLFYFQIYFLVMWTILVFFLICDTGYYSYFQDHFNVLIFAFFQDDTWALIKTIWKNYPVVSFALAMIVFSWFSSYIIKQILTPIQFPVSKMKLPVLVLILGFTLPLFLLSLGARGSLGLFPLSVADTVVSSRSFVNHLSYNGFHALIRAIKLKSKQDTSWDAHLKYFSYTDPRLAFADYYQIPVEQVPKDPLDLLRHKTKKNLWAEKTRPHVIILMMESFASSYLAYDSPQFNVLGDLKKHFTEDFLSLQFLPGHGSTIGSLSSFMISSPQRPLAGFLTETDMLQVPFRSSGAKVFSSSGYTTRFLYGGNPGWRDINKFARFQGFDLVEGEVDVEKKLGPLKEKHDWGVYDEDLLKYIFKILTESNSPQFILTMTTTNHPPYQIPSTYQAKSLIPPDNLKSRLINDYELVKSRFLAYQYANQKLGEFLTKIKNSPLAEKVIIAVTGDHSFWMVNFTDQELLKKWGVPFYLYTPAQIKSPRKKDLYGSHIDILPTLYNLALSEKQYDTLGVDLMDEKIPHFAFTAGLLAMSQSGAIIAGEGNTFHSFDWSEAGLTPSPSQEQNQFLAKKYKSLMGITDYYFMREKGDSHK